jgi:probable rRNA maturation factor
VSITVEFAIESPLWASTPDAEQTVRRGIEAAIADAGPAEAEVGVVLADDARVRALNRVWLDDDKATNVLSFPAPPRPHGGPRFLGDIVLAAETIRREAAAEGKTIEDHLTHLAVHGTLHLLGFDHGRDGEAKAMEGRERRILARLGISDPYAGMETSRAEPA